MSSNTWPITYLENLTTLYVSSLAPFFALREDDYKEANGSLHTQTDIVSKSYFIYDININEWIMGTYLHKGDSRKAYPP